MLTRKAGIKQFCFSFKHDFHVSLGSTPSHLQPRLAYYNTFLVYAGMRGAKAGTSPPRRNPLAYSSIVVCMFKMLNVIAKSNRTLGLFLDCKIQMVMENRPVDPGSIQGSHRPISFIRIKRRTRANDILCKTEY